MDGNVDRGEALAILGAAVSLGHQQILHHVHIVLQCHHALAVVVTPLSVAAPFWNKLLRASVVQNAEGLPPYPPATGPVGLRRRRRACYLRCGLCALLDPDPGRRVNSPVHPLASSETVV